MNLYTTKFSTHKISSQSLEVRYVLDIMLSQRSLNLSILLRLKMIVDRKNVTNLTQWKVEKVSAGKSFTNCEIIILLIF